MIDTASEFYMAYVRSYLWIVFIAGLAVIAFLPSRHSGRYLAAYKKVIRGSLRHPDMDDIGQLSKANFLTMFPVMVWFLVFGAIATVLDVILGPT